MARVGCVLLLACAGGGQGSDVKDQVMARSNNHQASAALREKGPIIAHPQVRQARSRWTIADDGSMFGGRGVLAASSTMADEGEQRKSAEKVRIVISDGSIKPNNASTLQMRDQSLAESDSYLAWEHDLWDGGEAAMDAHVATLMQELSKTDGNGAETNQKTQFRMMLAGMFDSGTNLMELFARGNVPGIQIYNVNFGKKTGIWKHTYPSAIAAKMPEEEQKKTVLIAMVRNPIAQIAGWKKAPYALRKCLSSQKWLEGPCQCGQGGGQDCTKAGGKYQGFADVWNTYVRQYRDLATQHFRKVLLIRYEDLVLGNLDSIAEQISQSVDLQGRRHGAKVIGKPAKNHGAPVGRNKAIDKIKNRTYRSSFNKLQLKKLCKSLDAELLKEFQYDSECF